MRGQVVHFDLDGFFVAVERARHPELRGQPVVIGGRPDGEGRVAAASAEALAAGVTVGLPLREAALRCLGAHFLPGDLEGYGEVADAADAILRRAFARVEWVSLDEAYVDAVDLQPRVGGLLVATESVQASLRQELGLEAACGIGVSKITARVASRLARPSGLLYVLPGYDRRFLAPLAIELLPGLPERLREALAAQGIDTVGGLAGLSDDVGGASADLALWRRLASGDDDRAVLGATCPRAVSVHARLEGVCIGAEGLTDRVQELARELASDLVTRRLLARQLTVRAADVTQATHSGTTILTTGTSSATMLAAAAVGALRRALGWPRSVTRLSVRASSLCVCDAQPSLFAPRQASPSTSLGASLSDSRRARDARELPRYASRARVARGLRDLERVLLAAGDRVLTRRAS